jgi:hypothetical protein
LNSVTVPWAIPVGSIGLKEHLPFGLPNHVQDRLNPLHRVEKWQLENLPKMEAAGVITRCISPWSAKTKWVPKPEPRLEEWEFDE